MPRLGLACQHALGLVNPMSQENWPPSDTPRAVRPALSIVMPCLNEAETVGVCIRKANAALQHIGISGEIFIIADNGSILLGLVGYAAAMPRLTLHGVTFDVNTPPFASLAIMRLPVDPLRSSYNGFRDHHRIGVSRPSWPWTCSIMQTIP